MKNKFLLSISVFVFGILTSGAIISFTNAQTTVTSAQTQSLAQSQEQKILSNMQYPIAELGNCQSKSDCKIFCDNSKNSDACLAFAKQHNLMSSDELANAKKFQDKGMVGPGGCKGQVACEQYCGNSTHLEECTAFAQENGLMSDQQLKDSKKVLAAMKNGLKPPACSGTQQCNTYCSSPEHMEECMTFSLAAGIVPDDQKDQMQKTLDALKNGAKPPACQPNQPGQTGQTNQSGQGLQSCDEYCGTHMEECMNFSLAAGMVPDNQKEQMQKTLTALKQGIKPPACQPNQPSESEQQNQTGQPNQPNPSSQSSQQGLQKCDLYCADPSHIEECVKFSVAVGNMTEQQAQTSIKLGGKGPGGCIGKDACNTFCNIPDNQETCFNFGKENGMISQEDLQKMQEGQQKMKDSFSQIPQEVLDCITSSLGAGVVEKMKNGSMIPQNAGDSINQCFQKFGSQGQQPNQSGQNQQGQSQNQQGQQGQNQSQNGFNCSPKGTAAAFVCGKNGRNANSGGPETTYFNSCTAKQDGAEIIHEGVCEGHKPCGDVADPVCGNDGQTWVSACYAIESGGGVKYEGTCKGQSNKSGQQDQQPNQSGQNQQGQPGDKFQPGPGTVNPGGQQMPQQAGPGGCKGPDECQKYCASNPDVCKNFKPQQNQQGQSGQQPNQPGQNEQRQPGQFNQPGQMQPQQQQQIQPQFNQDGQQGQMQPGQPNQINPLNSLNQLNQFNQLNPLNQPNQPGQQPGQFNQPGQMQPQQQQQPQFQQQPQQQQNPPSPSSSLLKEVHEFLANVLYVIR